MPALTVASDSIEFARKDDDAYAGVSGGPTFLVVALVVIGSAHLVG